MRRTIPSLNWLRVFEATARLGSFSAAGKSLHMSASAVSQQVNALESHLRTELFKRGPRSVSLTDAGTNFAPTVQQSLNALESAADSLFRGSPKAIVNLQVSLIFATSWLAPRLHSFSEQNPDTVVHISGGYRDSDIDRLGPELFINFGAVQRSWGVAEPLLQEKIYPVISRNLATSLQSCQDVLQYRLIEVTSHKVNWTTILNAHGVAPALDTDFVQVDTSEIALAMAASGYGIALARTPVTDVMLQNYGLVACPEFVPIAALERYYLMYRSESTLSSAAKEFRLWIKEQLNSEIQELT
ncbi:MAG: LysR family transcriptional regulator [Oceanospirillaceae bacterium]